MQERVPDLQTGIFAMPEPDYRMAPGISQSALKEMRYSPLHYKTAKETPRPTTPAMLLGRAIHRRILEDNFFEEYALPYVPSDAVKDLHHATKERKADKAAYLARCGGKIPLTEGQYDVVKGIQSSLAKDGFVNALLRSTEREISAFWKDPTTNLQCKGRADAIQRRGSRVLDIKTMSRRLTAKQCRYAAYDGLWHVQAAWYLDGLSRAGSDHFDSFLLLCVETEAPYAHRLWQMPDKMIDEGRALYKRWLQRLAECIQDNAWPGYESGIAMLESEENEHEPF